MFATVLLLAACFTALVAGQVGSQCSAPLGPGNALPHNPFWLESIKHQGKAAFNPNPDEYPVFRNVKDFGAIGDGLVDDTAAINNAISAGGRCGQRCESSTTTPALVYFPKGKYLVSSPIIALYYTQLIGDAKTPPTLLASPLFDGIAVIDADPYIPGGSQYYVNQNNFYRSVRNLVIDLRLMPASVTATGLHWQVSQATSLINIVVHMSTESGNSHIGLFMENGSGGYMGDLVFNGGKYGLNVGNQQFTVRNITVNNADTAIFAIWNWGWTFQGVTINNCQVGFDLGSQSVEAEAIIDAVVIDTPVFIRTPHDSDGKLDASIVLNNIKLQNVSAAVAVKDGRTVLQGGTTTIKSWGQGNVFAGSDPTASFTQGDINNFYKPDSLLDDGRIFGRSHPQYASYSVSQFISVKDLGAKGDGYTDDTAALQAVFDKFSGCKIIFFDAGTYIVTTTLKIPAGTKMVGEAWSVIAGRGKEFQDQDRPKVVIQVGDENSRGVMEITDFIFSTVGPAAGAIVVEWNIHDPSGEEGKGAAGMWDSHIRLGGAAGTNLQSFKCPAKGAQSESECTAAFMALHLTPKSSAYLEGTWVWLADHDLDHPGSSQISLYSGRGILSESKGPVWMIGTASEHHTLYQYNLVNAKDHYMGLIQTESPYYQPVPAAPTPFSSNSAYYDPQFTRDITSAWGLRVRCSKDIVVFGAGLYSFFQNYKQDCADTHDCQNQIVTVDSNSSVYIYSLSTVATTFQISVNERGVIHESGNHRNDRLASTVTLWYAT